MTLNETQGNSETVSPEMWVQIRFTGWFDDPCVVEWENEAIITED